MELFTQRTFRELSSAGHLEYSDGYRTKKAELGPEGFPILRVAEVLDGRIRPTFAEFVRNEFAPFLKGKLSRPGDVVLTTKGTVGRVAMIRNQDTAFAYSPQVCYFRTSPVGPLKSQYLYYWLRSSEFRNQAAAMKGQTDMADYLNLSDIGTLRITLPSLTHQQAITEVLGALDDKIAVNERIAETSIALGDGLHEILLNRVGSSRTATISELASAGHLSFGDGYRTKRSEHGSPGLPILRVAEVGDGEIRPSFASYVRDEFRPVMGGKVSRPGDVVLTTKGTVGRVALITSSHPEFVYSPQVCYFRISSTSPVSNFYLFHWFRGKSFWLQANGLKGQTDMADYLSLRDVKSLRITVPQQEKASAFNETCAALHSKVEAARSETRVLTDLRDTLLPQLVTGKLRIKDAERVVEDAV
ncbi:restriction endonuclease subunit S [Streptomyces albogriseolus]|uniref:restriction endonuclease subunit S n=1 Tax=Streptomyces albogriseolus TaxID=1887 RepID=UPI003632F3B2